MIGRIHFHEQVTMILVICMSWCASSKESSPTQLLNLIGACSILLTVHPKEKTQN